MAKVAIGDGHSIFVLKGDYAYTKCRCGTGQLSNGNTKNKSIYSFALSNVKAVAAGEITPFSYSMMDPFTDPVEMTPDNSVLIMKITRPGPLKFLHPV